MAVKMLKPFNVAVSGAGSSTKAAPAQAASAAATNKKSTMNTDNDCSFFTKVIWLSPTEIPSSFENGISCPLEWAD